MLCSASKDSPCSRVPPAVVKFLDTFTHDLTTHAHHHTHSHTHTHTSVQYVCRLAALARSAHEILTRFEWPRNWQIDSLSWGFALLVSQHPLAPPHLLGHHPPPPTPQQTHSLTHTQAFCIYFHVQTTDFSIFRCHIQRLSLAIIFTAGHNTRVLARDTPREAGVR